MKLAGAGTILGMLAVQEHPELFHAHVGSAQMVAVNDVDRNQYRTILDHADATGDSALAAELRSWGEPPYGGQDVARSTRLMAEANAIEDQHVVVEHADNWTQSEFGVLDNLNAPRGFSAADSGAEP